MAHRDGNKESDISRYINVDKCGSESHQDVMGGSGTGEINIGESGIQDVVFGLEYLLLVTAERIWS